MIGSEPLLPVVTSPERDALPRRTWIVRAYVAFAAAELVYGTTWMIAHERLSAWMAIWSVALTGIFVLLIWNASKAGWTILTAWTVVSIPFVLEAERAWLYLGTAMQLIESALLLSPWMVRWIWGRRTGAPATVPESPEGGR